MIKIPSAVLWSTYYNYFSDDIEINNLYLLAFIWTLPIKYVLTVQEGELEIWELFNLTTDAQPTHTRLVQLQLLS